MDSEITRGLPESIVMWKEEDKWVIKHEKLDVTTQGDNRYHALLMLADAIRAKSGSEIDLLEMSEDVFKTSEDLEDLLE